MPGLFDPAIVRDPAYNVANWNLQSRSVTRRDDGYEVDGRPLAFFHYSGYSPRQPHILFTYHHDDDDRGPTVLLSEHAAGAFAGLTVFACLTAPTVRPTRTRSSGVVAPRKEAMLLGGTLWSRQVSSSRIVKVLSAIIGASWWAGDGRNAGFHAGS